MSTPCVRDICAVLAVAAAVAGGAAGCGEGQAPSPVASPSPLASSARVASPSPEPADLAEPGPYGVGRRTFAFVDPDRDGRPVEVWVRYPALVDPGDPAKDAPPDPSGAPYPVILGDADIAAYLGEHLTSHGFVFVEGLGQRTWGSGHPTPSMVDYPLDLMVGLDGLAALEDDPLATILDTDRAGVVGYSFGAWTALTLAGARVDPDHYLATCSDRPAGWPDHWFEYICGSRERWDSFVRRGVEAGVAGDDGLWRAFGDERIRAVVPMMPEGFDLVGERGIASATADALFLAGSADIDNDYDPAALSLFEHYPADRLAMVTFVGADHGLLFAEDGLAQIRRLTTLFFDARLRGGATADLLARSWIEGEATTLEPHPSYETLVWGAVEPSGD